MWRIIFLFFSMTFILSMWGFQAAEEEEVITDSTRKQKETMPFMPECPPELSHLEMMVGEWTSSGELRVLKSGEVMKSKGTSSVRRICHGWGLLKEWELASEDDPEKKLMGVDIMTWDIHGQVFRVWGFNSRGTHGSGTGTYDQETQTWHFSNQQKDWTGGAGFGDEKITIKDPDTLELKGIGWGDRDKKKKFSEYSALIHRK